MVSSSELTKTSSQVITPVGQRLNPVYKARKLQQATQNTVKSNTPATKDTVIIESEVDSNLLSFSQSEASYDESLRLLSVNEARKLLGVSHITLKRLIEEGKIKAVRINTRYKISTSVLQEFIRGTINVPESSNETSSNQTPDSILDDLINEFSK